MAIFKENICKFFKYLKNFFRFDILCISLIVNIFYSFVFLFYYLFILPSGGGSVPFVHPRKYAPVQPCLHALNLE